jgi:mannose-6-phosphate isomerase
VLITDPSISVMPLASVYPLTFVPIIQPKVWGCEYWHVADLDFTTGSSEPARSVIDHGPLAGQSIHDLISLHHQPVMGSALLTEKGNFPLLIKHLQANENLSIQVHPTAEYVRHHAACHLKSEAWYILDAQPGAVIYKGLVPGVDSADIRKAVADGSLPQLLTAIPVKPGDFHYLPSGLCHALGAGVTVAEVQTPSDTTFRLFDWGRQGRTLHVEQALECLVHQAPPMDQPLKLDGGRRLMDGEYFRVDEFTAGAGEQWDIPEPDRATLWMIIRGSGVLHCQNTVCDTLPFGADQTLLIPASTRRPVVHFNAPTTYLSVTPSGRV